MKLSNRILQLLLFLVTISLPQISGSAFYEYVDKNGVRHFTDYQGDIPENSFEKAVEHKDRYDYMSDDEKKKAIIEEEEKRKKDEKIKTAGRSKTRVIIQNNQVRVPVTLRYNGNYVTTTLLLDTGANSTVIHESVALQLDLDIKARGYAQTAGGGTVRTSIAELDSIQVGPKTIQDPDILIMKYNGSPGATHGLLGLDFLKHFRHTIDFRNNYINWIN